MTKNPADGEAKTSDLNKNFNNLKHKRKYL